MSTHGNGIGEGIEPGDPASLNAAPAAPTTHVVAEDIVSVNKRGKSDNKAGKAIFLLVIGSVMVGGLSWASQNWLNTRKAEVKSHNGPKTADDTSKVFNPEKTGADMPRPKLGTDSGLPPPGQDYSTQSTGGKETAGLGGDGIRPLRGNDGKVIVNPQGRAMGVAQDGRIVTVPAIDTVGGEPAARRALPGSDGKAQGGGPGSAQGGGQPQKVASRFAGALFVGEPAKAAKETAESASSPTNSAQAQAQQVADILRAAAGGGSRPGAAVAGPVGQQGAGGSEQPRAGSVGASLVNSATPVAIAKRMSDQNLILPKGRQADCVLTGRIIDEVPGFTSCVLTQNLYSDNGRVLLMERGSELTGEYGTTNQLGSARLFVTWTRLKTPHGIEIDLSSPGADALGTSGVPGHLDNRWSERIGAALLISFVKDVMVAVIAKETATSSTGSTVNVQPPGQNTLAASSDLAQEVIRQTIKVRPRLTINQGDRISIYVARDLDFSPVYALRNADATATTRLGTP